MGDKVNLQFVVIKKGKCLLGHVTSKLLGLVLTECNAVGENIAAALEAKKPKVFDGVKVCHRITLPRGVTDSTEAKVCSIHTVRDSRNLKQRR